MKPYYTSNDLIEAVQRKIAFPISQETFSNDDILRFANEETFIDLVPSVLQYHQEYFVFAVTVPLVNNQSRYAIPDRAIGMRMRDVLYQDTQGNLFDMTRVDAADKAFFQSNVGANSSIHKFYIEGNEIVLLPQVVGGVTGNLVFYIYLRPNQLVANTRAATLQSISSPLSKINQNFLAISTFVQVSPTNTITITAHGLSNGNLIHFESTGTLPSGLIADSDYFVVNSTTNTFQVATTRGGTPVTLSDVGSGVHNAIRIKQLNASFNPGNVDFTTGIITVSNHDYANNDKVLLTSTGVLPTPLVANKVYYVVNATANTIQLANTIGGTAISITFVGSGIHTISSDITTLTFDQVPANITEGSLIDFLQTTTGHRTYAYDVQVPTGAISGTTIAFATSAIPANFIVGDYIATANECIIPQIPSDLHNGLAERTCARILASLGDQAGLQMAQQKIMEIDKNQGNLLDNRAEGNPQKILARHSLLRYGRFFGRRRV